ncbi:energy-coupling factor ABC transporter permease [Neiella sp. HB171785]|uniref:Energy-coupling factor ABC transporter permease n=1 Tax=Neiella litorisoli TaxID=2771431 RepID=A0A8J6UIV6_9GAMM|nr:energy-coupling factor ABC transporter permease [Neiella litorisoli]MBD1389223.1 energy-coupling factor ABC transporter permease [Neiella litorisoli]
MHWELVGAICWLSLLLWQQPASCWRRLTSSPFTSKAFAASLALLAVLWQFDIELVAGLSLHFLLVTSAALILGFRLACWATSGALLLLAFVGLMDWPSLAQEWLFQVLPALVVSYGLLLVSRKYLPRHLFVFIFVNSFLAAALAIALSIYLQAGWFGWTGQFSEQQIDHYLLRMLPLMLFPEALLNGMLMTLLVVYKPDYVYTFSDWDYLRN